MLVRRVIKLAGEFGRHGYRRITGLLRAKGRKINAKRVQRIWRREGPKVPSRQPKRGRLCLTDGSCVRMRPAYRDHFWSYDFVWDQMQDGRRLRWLAVIDEFTRECRALEGQRRWSAQNVLDVLAELFAQRGTPGYLRSDNGLEFATIAVRE